MEITYATSMLQEIKCSCFLSQSLLPLYLKSVEFNSVLWKSIVQWHMEAIQNDTALPSTANLMDMWSITYVLLKQTDLIEAGQFLLVKRSVMD